MLNGSEFEVVLDREDTAAGSQAGGVISGVLGLLGV